MDEKLKIEFLDKPDDAEKEEDIVASDLNITTEQKQHEKTVSRIEETLISQKDKEEPISIVKRDINIYWSILFGSAGFVAFYGIFPYLVFEKLNLNYFIDIFRNRGAVPYVTTFVFFWAVAILFLKIIKINREKKQNNSAKLELGNCNKNDILQKIEELRRSNKTKASTLVSLIHNTFLRLDSIGRIENISETLEQQANIEITRLESSYSVVKTIIWAIPVLGFIGTVIGISAATGGFVELLQGASDFAEMKEPLKNVVNGLAKAFETTLLALFWSVIIMFFSTFVEKREENLVTDVEEYSIDYLHNKLQCDTAEPIEASIKSANWQEILKSFDRILDDKIVKWQNTFGQKSIDKSDSVKSYFESCFEEQKKLFAQLHETLDKNVVGISSAVESQKKLIQGFDGRWNEIADQTNNIAKEIDNRSKKLDEQFTIWNENFNKNLEKAVNTLNDLPTKLNESFNQVNRSFNDIARSLNNLPEKLAEYTNTIKSSIESITNSKAAREAVLETFEDVIKSMKDT